MQSDFYRRYITSHKWRRKAHLARERASHKCQVCGHSGKGLQAHHNTYERLGKEKDTDLVVLCYNCHSLYHLSRNHPRIFQWLTRLLHWIDKRR